VNWLLWFLLALSTAAFVAAVVLLLRGMAYRTRRPLRLRIQQRQDAPGDLFVLHLCRAGWARWLPLPRFEAGQSLALRIPGQPLKRRYSLARWRRLPWSYELAIKREDDGRFSRQLADHAQPGAELQAERPDGHFTLLRQPGQRHAVLIAGGVGITPLLAMLDTWSARLRPGYTEMHLYWQVRHEAEAIYRDTLAALARRHPGLHVRLLVSRPMQGEGVRINAGLLQAELGRLQDYDYYLCASNQLLDAMLEGLSGAGVPAAQLHYERFGLGALGPTDQVWTIQFEGRSFSSGGHASLLDAIEAQSLPLDADCRTGSCGRCLIAVAAGSAQHRVPPECKVPPGHVLACCALPASDVQLRPAAASVLAEVVA
jgi:ferredoxin-NADP reductase